MTPNETWKPIPDFLGYDVSDHGRVRSYHGRLQGNGIVWHILDTPQSILSPSADSGRYLSVLLRKDGTSHCMRIAYLVLLAFVGPRPEGLETCHNNGDPQNNHLANLRYDTSAANMLDACRQGRMSDLSHLDIIDIRNRRADGETYTSIASDYPVTPWTIGQICRGKIHRYADGPRTIGHHCSRKLSDSDIAIIREQLTGNNATQVALAREYDVSESMISRIKHGTRRASP